MNKFLKSTSAGLILLCTTLTVQATPITVTEQVNFSDFTSSTTGRSAVRNGIYDSFDESYRVQGTNTNISQARTVSTLNDIYTYSIYDLFTNNTGSAWSGTISYATDLGSDGAPTVTFEDQYRYLTDESSFYGDSAIAFTFGNNDWTASNADVYGWDFSGTTVNNINPRAVRIDYMFDLEIGESVALLNFATTIVDDTDRTTDWAQAAAISTVLTNAPRFDGLTDMQISNIVNWEVTEVPEPSTLAILGLGLMGLSLRRFKKQA
jgi:hypothetical protein